MSDAILERNKRNCIAFYEMMFNENRPREAVEKFTGATYIQHNPEVRDGKDGFVEYFERMQAEYPEKRVEIVRAIAEGHFVVLHAHQYFPESEWAGIDIFRLDDDGKVLEHWDCLTKVPPPSEFHHRNGMF